MVEYRGTWAASAVEEFLQDVAVPIRLATRRPDGSPWVVTLWYRYDDEAFECATSANADVVRYLRHDPDVGFDVSTNDPPYRGVRGNGRATIADDGDKAVLGDLLERYLGGTDSPLAERLLDDARDEVRIRVRPRSVYSWDYTERMAGAVE